MAVRGLWGAMLAAFALAAAAQGADTWPNLDFQVRIEPEARTLAASGTITLPAGPAVDLVLREDLEAGRVALAGRKAPLARRVEGGLQRWRVPASRAERRVEVEWGGTLGAPAPGATHRETLGRFDPVAGPDGAFLPSSGLWYPSVSGMLASYRVALDLPESQRGLVAGRLLEERADGGRYRAAFAFDAPAEGIDLMAGPYRIATRTMRSADGRELRLRTYFHPALAALSDGYLDSVRGYIERYERRIGAYPFTEFSVVSSPTPTGFGMPTLTYLGIDVLKLPFIRHTSLGHEVLHDWWGNGVYPDYASGNWAEGLTTFMADYAYREAAGEAAARESRLEWLRDFAAVPAGRDAPLAQFTSRTHGASQIVGYHKAAMLFLMLRDRIGTEAFDRALQAFWREHRFRVASWTDLRRAFEQASGEALGGFFAQWLTRPGAPALRMEKAATVQAPDGYRVDVTLVQGSPPYALRVPLVFRTPRGDETRWVTLGAERQTFAVLLDLQPTAVLLDPDFRVFRRLAPEEAPPILRQVMLDPSAATVIVSEGDAGTAARELAAKLQEQAPRFVSPQPAPPASPVLVAGLAADVDQWLARQGLPPRPAVAAGRGTAQVWTQARPRGGPVVVVSAQDAGALAALARPLPHYGRQSWIVFDGSRAIDRGVWPAQPAELALR